MRIAAYFGEETLLNALARRYRRADGRNALPRGSPDGAKLVVEASRQHRLHGLARGF